MKTYTQKTIKAAYDAALASTSIVRVGDSYEVYFKHNYSLKDDALCVSHEDNAHRARVERIDAVCATALRKLYNISVSDAAYVARFATDFYQEQCSKEFNYRIEYAEDPAQDISFNEMFELEGEEFFYETFERALSLLKDLKALTEAA